MKLGGDERYVQDRRVGRKDNRDGYGQGKFYTHMTFSKNKKNNCEYLLFS